MEEEVSGDQPALAGTLGTSDSVLCLSGGSEKNRLHYQCGGIVAHEPAQDHQDAWLVPDRRSRGQAAVSGIGQGGGKVGNSAVLEADAELSGHHVWRPNQGSGCPEVNPKPLTAHQQDESLIPRNRPSKFRQIAE